MSRSVPGIIIGIALPAACGILVVASIAASPVAAAGSGSASEIVFQSDEMRIYRVVRPDGSRALVLTNLDADGRRMGGEAPAAVRQPRAAEPPAAASTTPADEAIGSTQGAEVGGHAPAVQVIVNRGDGSQDAVDAGSVQVTPSGSGTTVVINIDAVAPQAPPVTAPTPVVFTPVVSLAGVPGPVRYPEHHHFLGYGHDNASPGFFSGLGLNASNGFGIGNRQCGRGFDCMLGPQRDHP